MTQSFVASFNVILFVKIYISFHENRNFLYKYYLFFIYLFVFFILKITHLLLQYIPYWYYFNRFHYTTKNTELNFSFHPKFRDFPYGDSFEVYFLFLNYCPISTSDSYIFNLLNCLTFVLSFFSKCYFTRIIEFFTGTLFEINLINAI